MTISFPSAAVSASATKIVHESMMIKAYFIKTGPDTVNNGFTAAGTVVHTQETTHFKVNDPVLRHEIRHRPTVCPMVLFDFLQIVNLFY
jgi:hypothetical protein